MIEFKTRKVIKMTDKKCPNCGTENKGLDLVETQGIYICSNCKKVIDAANDKILDTDQPETVKKITN